MRILKSNPVAAPTRERARQLRRRMTDAERTLWQILRGYGLGVKFRRQYPIGPYITDFYAPEVGFVIEIDGGSHQTEEALQYDRMRSDFLQQRGLIIQRYTNQQVKLDLDGVRADILRTIQSAPRQGIN